MSMGAYRRDAQQNDPIQRSRGSEPPAAVFDSDALENQSGQLSLYK